MFASKIMNVFISVYLIFAILTAGFIVFMLFESVLDEGSVDAATIIVDNDGGGDYTTIQAAINAANSSDTIYVWAGTYYENVVLNKTINLIGNGTMNTTINGGGNGDVVYVTADWVNITGFNITGSGSTFFINAGIKLNGVQYCGIINNNVSSNNVYGIFLNNSNNNTLSNNNVSSNNFSGINLTYSNDNMLINNTIIGNSWNGIQLHDSKSNMIINNTVLNNWVGIELRYSKKNMLTYNNAFYNQGSGINISESGSNILLNNNASQNNRGGIRIWYCTNENILINNTVIWNSWHGIRLHVSNNNMITNNTVLWNNWSGINLLRSNSNTFINNNVSLNNNHGTYLLESISNKLINNSVSLNTKHGIWLVNSNGNTLENNTASNNEHGIWLLNSVGNTLENNIASSNIGSGINITKSNSNTLSKNSASWNNWEGIRFERSNNNELFLNDIMNNGIGFSIDSFSTGNIIYHSHIISNSIQALDNGNNIWNNIQLEGNYWSDYIGFDNGANGRIVGDGIGDTNIPHLGMDNYPFIRLFGWIYPGTPDLQDPGLKDDNGNYKIKWNLTRNAIGYVLEEDNTVTFASPTLIYNGIDLNFQFENKTNDTYFYRVKAYNEKFESEWSNIVNIIVDWAPSAPTGLVIQKATGHEIILTWNPNSETDIDGYYILINDTNANTSGPFYHIHTLSYSTTQYTISNLIEETTYYFVVVAFDKVLNNSTFSNVAYATTLDVTAPEAPRGLNATPVSGTQIDLIWNTSSDQDLVGYIIFMNNTGEDSTGNFHIIHKLYGLETTYSVKGLTEEITYYFKIEAFDEVPNNSSFSKIASATTPDQTPPSKPEGLKVTNPTNHSLTISWIANFEPDVLGYVLYRSLSLSNPFIPIISELINENQFTDTDLNETSTYYYKVKAIDDANLESAFSDVAIGTTVLGPHSPEINNPIADFSIPEDSYDDNSINLYNWFKDINNEPLDFRCEGQDKINVTIFRTNGTVVLQPYYNWNGQEYLTFFASDGTFNVSDDVIITVIYINDPPRNVEIISPVDGIEIEEGKSLDFNCLGDDPDLPYGDELTFKWNSNIMGELGQGKNLNDTLLSLGEHIITLEVWDRSNMTSSATIKVTVSEKSESVERGDNIFLIFGTISIIIITLTLIMILIIIKSRRESREVEKDKKGIMAKTTSESTKGIQSQLDLQRPLSPSESNLEKNNIQPSTTLPSRQQQSPEVHLTVPPAIIDNESVELLQSNVNEINNEADAIGKSKLNTSSEHNDDGSIVTTTKTILKTKPIPLDKQPQSTEQPKEM